MIGFRFFAFKLPTIKEKDVRSLLALVAASALLLSGVAVAQDREEIEAKAEERLEQVIENLELTDEQVEALRPIFQSSFERQAAVLEQYGIDLSDGEQDDKLSRRERRKLRGDLKDERERTEDAIAEVLTDDQFDAYKETAEERHDEMRERLKDRRDN